MRAARVARDATLEKIVARTSYLRRAGRAAFINSAERADFARVKRSSRGQRKQESQQGGAMAAAMAKSGS